MTDSKETLLAQAPDAIGGNIAIGCHPSDHNGSFEVVAESNDQSIAVCPGFDEAARVARYAITPDGGYGSVSVVATDRGVTCNSLEEFIGSPAIDSGP